MPNKTKGLKHFFERKSKNLKEDNLKKTWDKVIYVGVIIGPIMNLPQLYKIWYYKTAAGVSALSWASFAIISLMWFIYGILHKEKPIIFMNLALIIVQALIAAGALIY